MNAAQPVHNYIVLKCLKSNPTLGIHGTYKITCNNVMKVLRTNQDSLVAVLETFVHDPLINWRLGKWY